MKKKSVMLMEELFLEEVQVASYLSSKHGKLPCVVIIIPLPISMESKLPDELAQKVLQAHTLATFFPFSAIVSIRLAS